MPRQRALTWCLAAVVVAVTYGMDEANAQSASSPPMIGQEVGDLYPDFLLPDLDGKFGRLSDFRGSKVLLIQFASW